jgi:membrane-associated phospholipid phosphatase
MGMGLTMALDYAHSEGKIYFKLLGFALAITFGITIAYSRLFLGVHSLD